MSTNSSDKKFCCACGRIVDLRTDYTVSEKVKASIKNADYHYVHKGECEKTMGWDAKVYL